MNKNRPIFAPEIIEVSPSSETSLEEARVAVERAVYKAAMYIERLEGAGKIDGGLHVARKIAMAAADEVESRWKDK